MAHPAKLIVEKLRKKVSHDGRPPEVVKHWDASAAAQESYRLSFAQEQLWFLEQLQPNTAVYHVPRAFRLRGPLDIQALRTSFDQFAKRHSILRTTYSQMLTEPQQTVHASLAVPFEEFVCQGTAAHERESAALIRIEADVRRLFDLTREPPIRVHVYRLGPQDVVLLIVLHHIACDGSSINLMFQEISERYAASRDGFDFDEKPLPISFFEYISGQRRDFGQARIQEKLDYWRQELAGAPELLDLPLDFSRPLAASPEGGRVYFVVPDELTRALVDLARRERATLFMVLMAGWQALLHRYGVGDDIVVGSPSLGRNRQGLDDVFGFLANTVAFRGDLSGQPSFSELLERVRETVLDGLDHSEVPFERVVECLHPTRSLSYTPVFQTALTVTTSPERSLQLPDVEISAVPVCSGTSKFDLLLAVTRESEYLGGYMEYRADLLRQSTVERMNGHFWELLQQAVTFPDTPIGRLSMLAASERQKILIDWNCTGQDYPQTAIHHRFEQQARSTPDAVAVSVSEQRTTYAALNRRANQIAHFLGENGVSRGDVVAVYLDRSTEYVAVILGILKAGGAYLPLDQSYPPARLHFILADSGARLLLTNVLSMPLFNSFAGRILTLRDLSETATASPDCDPAQAGSPDDLAYIVYTSGSTGKPKGVEVRHRGVLRLLFGVDYVSLGPDETFLQLAPLSFDASTFELWGPLLHGGRCALSPVAIPTAQELGQLIREHGVTTLWLTATLFNAIVDEAPEVLAPVRQLLTGGEALSPTHVRRALKELPDTQLINGYGPTESTTFACCYRIPVDLDPHCATIPIGMPIANTRIYVLDENGEPVPIGLPGELHIGGDGLARGYRGRPDLTAQRFLPDTFSDDSHGRLFRTGDRVRYLPDGNLEFLGRLDDQVKIHGFRITLNEIESTLAAHPEVRAAGVVVHEGPQGEKSLVGFVKAQSDPDATSATLRAYLRSELPDYMVPRQLVALPELPVSPNGKVDKRALQDLAEDSVTASRSGRSHASEAPEGRYEVALARMFAEVLGIDSVGRGEDFFELGGHSLLALRLFARIEQEFGVSLPLATLFESSTVAALAERFCQQDDSTDWSVLLPIKSGGSCPPLFLVHAIGGNILNYRELCKALGDDQPVYGLQARGLDGQSSPHTSIEEMAQDYLTELRTVSPSGSYILGGASFGGVVAYEMACQLERAGGQCGLLVLIDAMPPRSRVSAWSRAGLSERLALLKGRLLLHARNLWELPPNGRADYLGRSWRILCRRTSSFLWRCRTARQLRRGEALSPTLRNVKEASFLALLRYRPKPYHGRVLLLQATDKDPSLRFDSMNNWGSLLRGYFDVERIAATHTSILDQPDVLSVAEAIRRRIERVQQ